MTVEAVGGLRADHAAVVGLAATLTPEEWAAPSCCDGWAVRDVVAHMAQLFRQVVDPRSLPARDPSGSTERTQDAWVDAMRPLPVDRVVADYVKLGEQAIAVLATMQGNDSTIDLGDLGRHPLHLVANAFAFDHYTHLRLDLLAPRGPLIHPSPTTDDDHLAAVVDWMVAGLPQMCAEGLAELAAPVNLEITGAGARVVAVRPPHGPTVDEPAPTAAATVITPSTDLVAWGTRRQSWRELDVVLRGDETLATRFCDAVHVF